MVVVEITKEQIEILHLAVFFFRPAAIGQHRAALSILPKLEEVGAPSGPTNIKTGFTPHAFVTGVRLEVEKTDVAVMVQALEQGYEREMYMAGGARIVPEIIDRLSLLIKD